MGEESIAGDESQVANGGASWPTYAVYDSTQLSAQAAMSQMIYCNGGQGIPTRGLVSSNIELEAIIYLKMRGEIAVYFSISGIVSWRGALARCFLQLWKHGSRHIRRAGSTGW